MNSYMTGEDIEKIYREMELEIISSMKRNLSRHLKEEKKVGFEFEQWQVATLKEFKRFQRENKSIIGNYTSSLDEDIQETFQNELKKGAKKEFSKYKKIMGNKFKESDNLRGSFFKLNDRKIKGLIKSTNNDLSAANKACFRMANDQFRKTVIKSVMFSNHGIVSPKRAIDMATKEFLSNGLKTIQYKDGKRVNIASYAKMAVRTGNQRAQLIGEGQFRKEIGEHLVQITSHGGTCKLCSKWEGKILIDDVYSGGSKKDGKYPLLSTAMDQGLFHPNCEHGLPTYYKELDEIYEKDNPINYTDEQYQDKLNYINQNIYKYQRLKTGSLDEENIEVYSEKLNKWKELKQKMVSNIEDIKNDEKIPLTLNTLPKEFSNEINDIISNSPPTIKKLLKNNEDSFKFKNIKSVKTARYSPLLKNIKLNLKVDQERGYKTLFHEMSHQLDHILRNISQNNKFEQLIVNDFNRIKSSYMLKYGIDEKKAYEEIGNMLKKTSKANSVSDIVGGITKNKCVGNAFHRNKYWEIKGRLSKEMFAHFGSALIRKDKEELELLRQFFPSAYQYFKDELKRSI